MREIEPYGQTATRHYHEPVAPHSDNQSHNLVIGVFGLMMLILVIVGVIGARQQVVQASVFLVYILIGLSFVVVPALVIYPIWHKSYLDKLKRRHATIDLQAKEDAVRRANELHALTLQEAQLFADTAGNYPAVYNRQTGQVVVIQPGQFIQPVPQHLHYDLDYHQPKELQAGPAAEQSRFEQPRLETIISELHPNALEFVFGMDTATGSLIKTTLPKAVHIQLLGASGQGKSRQATSILTQLTAKNDTSRLHLALLDCEGETTAPFQQLPHVRYHEDDPKGVARVLHMLVGELERRDRLQVVYPVVLVFVEEFLNLRRIMPADFRDQALEDYTTIALRGRKRGMFLFSIGQTAYVDKSIRDAQMQFLSSMAFAVKPTAARAAGFTNTELLNKLYAERRPGQFLLERPSGDALVAAPYVDEATVVSALSTSQVVPGHFPGGSQPSFEMDEGQPGKQAEVENSHIAFVRELIRQQKSQNEIIALVFPGMRNADAIVEYRKLLAILMKEA